VTIPKAGRGAAFGDLDNDGDIDIVINNVNDTPDVFRLDQKGKAGHWITLTLAGTTSHRQAIGARVKVIAGGQTFVDEVRGGGSYYAQNDFRIHVGLGAAAKVDRIEVRWPNGLEEAFPAMEADRFVTLKEGTGQRKGTM
jgi:enediyne biosynthesis protein E4